MIESALPNRPAQWGFHVSALAVTGVYALLAWESCQDLPMPIETFWIICVLAFSGSCLAAVAASKSRGGIGVVSVLIWCAVIRGIGIAGEPIFEDDYFRYLWDGRQTVETGKPYEHPPSHAFESEQDPTWSEILDNINNPEIRTVYGPVNQYLFGLAYLVAPANVDVLQTIFAIVDLLVILLLVRLAKLGPLVLYGFSPLIVKEFSFTAHPDVVAVCALLVATVCWRHGRLFLTALSLGIAVGAKVFALILVPLLLRLHWRYWAVFAATLAILYVPLLPAGESEGLVAMLTGWLFNAPIYYLLYQVIDPVWIAGVLLSAFAVGWVWYYLSSTYDDVRPPSVPRADVLFMLLLLALPAFNAWYLVFVLVFATIRPTAWAWVASLTVLLFSYATGLQLGFADLEPYQHPSWALWAQFAPIAVAMVFPVARRYWSETSNRG